MVRVLVGKIEFNGQAKPVSATPGLVTLHVWGISRRQLPWALGRMALGRRPLRTVPGLRFARLLGTSHGRTFTATDADPLHWALLSCWDSPAQAATFERSGYASGWDARSDERLRLELLPLSSTGHWSRMQPFGPEHQAASTAGTTDTKDTKDTTGPCAILTRARLVPSKAMTFRRAVPPVAAGLRCASGLRLARGIGEVPIGLQATFSVWDDLAAAKKFAYGNVAHRDVVRRTAEVGWYAEQLFARFAVIGASGELDGRGVA
jgi:hypothetical protein